LEKSDYGDPFWEFSPEEKSVKSLRFATDCVERCEPLIEISGFTSLDFAYIVNGLWPLSIHLLRKHRRSAAQGV
jgi:hypothetical protein